MNSIELRHQRIKKLDAVNKQFELCLKSSAERQKNVGKDLSKAKTVALKIKKDLSYVHKFIRTVNALKEEQKRKELEEQMKEESEIGKEDVEKIKEEESSKEEQQGKEETVISS